MSAPQQSAQDVLVAHAQRYDEDLTHPYMCACGWTCDEEDIDYSLPGDPGEQWDRLHAAHVLDTFPRLGWAIVKLPEPDHRCDRDSAWITPGDEYYQVDYDRRTGVYVSDRTTTTGQVFGPVTQSEGRAIAAALLAAHAEEGEERG